MIARVARFEQVDVDEVERTREEAEVVIRSLVEGLAGYRGHLELLAEDGRVLSVTLFETDEEARAAEQVFDEEMPRRLGDLFEGWAGHRVSVDHYRVLSEGRR